MFNLYKIKIKKNQIFFIHKTLPFPLSGRGIRGERGGGEEEDGKRRLVFFRGNDVCVCVCVLCCVWGERRGGGV